MMIFVVIYNLFNKDKNFLNIANIEIFVISFKYNNDFSNEIFQIKYYKSIFILFYILN